MPAYRPSARASKKSFAYNPQTSPKCYLYIYIYIYRGAKTLKDNLIHNKLPSLNDNLIKNAVYFESIRWLPTCIQDTLSSRAALGLPLGRASASREQRYLAYKLSTVVYYAKIIY